MSTFKKILEPVLLGVSIIIGIAVVFGKITIYESWFSLRTLQISLGSGICILLLLYIQLDRKNLSPNNLKNLVFKSKLATVILFIVFLWGILNKPVIPVNVSFEGVAKTSDVVAIKTNIQKTNENVTELATIFSIFLKKQEQENKNLLLSVIDGNKKFVEMDQDERIRQEAIDRHVADVATDLKKVVVGIEDIKKNNKTTSTTTLITNGATSERNRFLFTVLLLCLALISFIFSFFYKTFTKVSVRMRRYGIPFLFIGIVVILQFCPLIFNVLNSGYVKNISVKDTLKKELPIVSDTPQKQKEPEVQVQVSPPSKLAKQQMGPMRDPTRIKKKKSKNITKVMPHYTSPRKYMRVEN